MLLVIEKIKKTYQVTDNSAFWGTTRNICCEVKFGNVEQPITVDCAVDPTFRNLEEGDIVITTENGGYTYTGCSIYSEEGKDFTILYLCGKTHETNVEEALSTVKKYKQKRILSGIDAERGYKIVKIARDEELERSKPLTAVYVTLANHLTFRFDTKNRPEALHWQVGDFLDL